jgi:CubicO group peptidase (beta-lactamase class C family)
VGIAVDKGMIPDIKRPVYAYFPDYKGTAWIDGKYDINIKHLLTMSAGVSWDERSRSLDDLRNSIIAMFQSDDWIRYVLERKLAGTPGQTYNYSGGLNVLLGEILHRASGLYADEFAEKHLFAPLDISENGGDKLVHGSGEIWSLPRAE